MKILVSALEPSSNLHLESLLSYLDGVELCGIFDPKLGDPLFSSAQFSVMGFTDVAKNLPFFWRAKREMIALAKEADKILLMDSSSFNIPLAKAIKKLYPNKEIIYYILPQVWAWKSWRAKEIEESCDKLAAILPFEVNYYENKAKYVGHPLLDQIPNIDENRIKNECVAFMPGSRLGEISRLFPIFSEVASEICVPKILVVPQIYKGRNLSEIYGDVSGFEVSFDTHDALLHSSFAFVCSGTATLEATLFGVPFVLAYRARAFDYFIVKNLVKINYIGLANIFEAHRGSEPLHEELLQERANKEELLRVYRECDRDKFLARCRGLREYLGHGSAENTAQWIK
ncbi:MAG: lipid-A-disaccharide synthase [Wolinella sp.]